MENNRQEFKKRLKGLLGLVLIMGMMIQLSPLQVFAQTYGINGDSNSLSPIYLQNGDTLEKTGSGGSFILNEGDAGTYIDKATYPTIINGTQTYYKLTAKNLNEGLRIKVMIENSNQDELEPNATKENQVLSNWKCRNITLSLVPITFNVNYHNENGFLYSDIGVQLNSPVKSPAELGINLGGWITYSWKTDDGAPVTNITGDSTLFLNTIDNTKAEGERIIGACWLLPGRRYVLGGTKSTDGYTYQLGTDVYVSGNPDSDPQTYVVTN